MYITRPHRPEINVHFERKLLARLQSRNSRAMNTAPSVPAYGPITGHARVKGDIFGVYHGDPKLLFNMPSTNEAPSPSPSSMQGNFWSPSYVSPSTPYIPFIPLTNPWYGPLLGRLYYGHVIPVEEVTPGRWGLPPRIREDWYALELNLHAVLFAMMERSRLQHPQCMVPFGYPYRFGYLVLYRTRNAARYIACCSINGFLPLLGNLSMFFFYLRLAEMTIGLEGWRDEVCKVAQVHPQWLADLEHSAAGDLTIPRIGGIIDLSLPPGTDPTLVRESELDFMIGSIISKRLRIPLYIRWGKIGHYAQVRALRTLLTMQMVPDGLEIKYLHELPGEISFSPCVSTCNAEQTVFSSCRHSHPYVVISVSTSPDIALMTPAPFPPVEAHSGQHPGEDMESFLLGVRKEP
ncbi:hypothetical protein B0H10DRAFT_1958849 [Mycena sp. CBHHK59/15]|nr:hypothetical protein B0H10DRAFT_1958849 [Mycena sp. CBHHK59/15]